LAIALKTTPSTLFTARLDGGDPGEIGWEIVRGKILDVHFDQTHKRTAEVRFGCPASIHNHADCRDDAAMRVNDIDCFLHAAAAGDDVFDDHEFLAVRNLETAAQNELAFVFLDKNVALA
jgi:hypothetical protein